MSEMTWYQRARLHAIEVLANWLGQVNTTDLTGRFGISRVIAQRDIVRYLNIAPGNLSYQPPIRAYAATSIFKPVLTAGTIDEYLSLEKGAERLLHGSQVVQLAPPPLTIKPAIVRPIMQAISLQHGVNIHYTSFNHPKGTDRLIYPHSLVNSGFRWHIRAFCTTRNDFRDFNISRILKSSSKKAIKMSETSIENDLLWNKNLTLILGANPNLSKQERQMVEQEFGMIQSKLELNVRAALLPYVLQIYQVDENEPELNTPKKNRLVILNREVIEKYLW